MSLSHSRECDANQPQAAVLRSPNRLENALLAALPDADRAQLLPDLRPVPLSVGTILSDYDEQHRRVHFPTSGVVSLVAPMLNGTTVEMATVGREGMVEVEVILGTMRAQGRQIVQLPGDALVMNYEQFERWRVYLPRFRELLLGFAQAFLKQVLQSVACNAVHSAQERAARWLLMCEDRSGGGGFSLTQDFLSAMLGVGRPHVNEIARNLRKEGLIHYRRGLITILDRHGLERVSCECYPLIRQAYESRSISLA